MLILYRIMLIGSLLNAIASTSVQTKAHQNTPAEMSNCNSNKYWVRNAIPTGLINYGIQKLPIISEGNLLFPQSYVQSRGSHSIPNKVSNNALALLTNIHDATLQRKAKSFCQQRDRIVASSPKLDQRELRKTAPPNDEDMLRLHDELLGIKNNRLTLSSPKVPTLHIRPDLTKLTKAVNKMTPEAQNTLVEILLKALVEKVRVESTKSSPPPLHVPPFLDPSLMKISSFNRQTQKATDGTSVIQLRGPKSLDNLTPSQQLSETPRPADERLSLTVNKENLERFTQTTERGDNGEKVKCPMCQYVFTATRRASGQGSNVNNEEQVLKPLLGSLIEREYMPERNRLDLKPPMTNVTQIFNVHPKLLVVNSNLPLPSQLSRVSKKDFKIRPNIQQRLKGLKSFEKENLYFDIDGHHFERDSTDTT